MKRRKLLLRAALCLFCLAAIYAAISAAAICLYAERDETRAADAAIVLGAAAYESGPSPVYRERLNHGVWLYRNGYVRKLILTGGTAAGNSRSDAAIGAEYVLAQGVLAEDVLLEETSVITEENLENAAEILKREGLQTVLIVSDPLHMKRAMLQAADKGLTAWSSPTPTTRYQSFWPKLGFLARETFFYVGYRLVRIFR